MKYIFSNWLCILVLVFTYTETAFSDDNIIDVSQKTGIKAVYDINQDKMSAGIGRALYYARGLLEAYKNQDIKPDQLHISLVIHGSAGYWMLNDESYQMAMNDPFAANPNTQVIQELIDHGVSVELCHVTMKGHGWTKEDIIPGVKVVFDAYTRLIDLQNRGYAYIKFM